jgi:hypothetical protein
MASPRWGGGGNGVYLDHGLTGTNRQRPGPRETLAACREPVALVAARLDHLARSPPVTTVIADELTTRRFVSPLGGSVADDQSGRSVDLQRARDGDSSLV